ncbi:MAG: putative lipid II flippase FtsW [Pseudomonadales bacterium]
MMALINRIKLPSLSLPHFPEDVVRRLDWRLIMIAGALLLIGVVVVASASMEVANAKHNNPFYHVIRHLVFLAIALVIGSFSFLLSTQSWNRLGWLLLAAAFALLILVIMPGVGREVNGSMRWIRIGPINVQTSELAKLFMVVYLAGYLARRLKEVRVQWSGFLKPMMVLVLMVLLLLMEPDFGAAVVLMGAALGMMFLGGVRLTQFLVLICVSLTAIAGLAVSQPYRMQRLITFMDPWAEENVFDSGYQLTQALIAFGRGEWWGVGIGNSVQKLFYLPEAHTDFVYAILAEETGLIGAALVIALFFLLAWRIMQVGRQAEKLEQFFSAYMTYGIAFLFSAQALINIGVNTGLLPTKGLTLPLLSYGGSSLIVCCIALAMVLRVDYENKRLMDELAVQGEAEQ